jgi:RsiW-degrading membrane proteinase PrsW (M82 family)
MNTSVDTSTLIFECIDGKDDHFKIEVGNGQRVMLGCASQEGVTPIRELENGGGRLVLTNTNGLLQLDASGCPLPVKVNGNVVTSANVGITDVLKVGDSIWKAFPAQEGAQAAPTAANAIRNRFNNLIGLEALNEDFKLKDIFSRVFQKHSLVQMEDQLVTGTFNNTPSITEIETNWAKPWLFSRLLLVSVSLALLMVIGFRTFENPLLIPGLIFVGAFAVPISTLVFFLEMNAPRNISIFMTMSLLFIGGIGSIIIALIFFDKLEFLSDLLSASAAGIIEEVAKILIVIFVMGKFTRYKWVLNGLLFGAAVGTGFAAFESMGYAFRGDSFNGIVDSIMLRGILAPFCHIIWTGNAAAALWLVKGDRKFSWSMLGDPRFIRVFLSSVILHMLWNSSWSLFPIPVFLDAKLLILGIIGWIITLRLIQLGLKQLNESRHQEIERLRAN